MVLIVVLAISLALLVAVGRYAEQKGRSVGRWVALGFFTTPLIPLMALYVMGPTVAAERPLPNPVLLDDGTVMVFTAGPDGVESQQVGPGDDDYPYWVGEAQKIRQPARPADSIRRRPALIVVALVVLLGLVALWSVGTFDHALVNIGLNAQRCARNGFGATFCGKELDEYNARLQRAKEQGEAITRKVEAEERRISEQDQHTQEAVQQQYESSAP